MRSTPLTPRSLSDSLTRLCSLPYWYAALKEAWDRRDADHKFKIVCYVHNAKDMEWQRWIPYWAQRNAIRLLAIGNQYVASSLVLIVLQPHPTPQRVPIHKHERMMWLEQSSHMCVSRRVSLQDSVSGAGL